MTLQLVPREKQKHAYLNAVKERYKHLPEISRIERYYQSFYISLYCSGERLLKLFWQALRTLCLSILETDTEFVYFI